TTRAFGRWGALPCRSRTESPYRPPMGERSAAIIRASQPLPFQNSGARTGKQLFRRVEGAAERPAQGFRGALGDPAQARGRDRVGGEREHEGGELKRVVDAALALRSEQHAENLVEILRVRTCYHCRAELGGFERVLPAMLDQASAQEGEIAG